MTNEASYIPTKYIDAMHLLCEDQIGSGCSRTVYTSPLLNNLYGRDCVVKLEDTRAYFQNIMEWETWQRIKDTKLSCHFAPCLFISPNGLLLVQERTYRPSREFQWPSQMPEFFGDFKYANYGLLYPPFYEPHISDNPDSITFKLQEKHNGGNKLNTIPSYIKEEKAQPKPFKRHLNSIEVNHIIEASAGIITKPKAIQIEPAQMPQSNKPRFVCHDYGTNLLMEFGMSDKLKDIEWWE